jgi:hypothetical protein
VISPHTSYARTAAKIGGPSAVPRNVVPQLGLYEGKGEASGAEEDAIRSEQFGLVQ